MQSQQLLPKGEVLQEEFFSGAKDGEDPAEQMSKAHKHQGIIAKSAPGRCSSKSLILRLCRVLARHSVRLRGSAVPFAVGAYITAAYWFTASTSFANPAVTLARSATNTFAGIRPADALDQHGQRNGAP